jgi:segregation and condensation protein B
MQEVEENIEVVAGAEAAETPAAVTDAGTVIAREETAPEETAADEAEPVSNEAEPVSNETAPVSDDVVIAEALEEPAPADDTAAQLKAIIEAAIYITDEPLTAEQIATAVTQPLDQVKAVLTQLVAEYAAPDRGLSIRELAGGYKMATKPEHHEAIRRFVKGLQAPLKLSLAALETLAVVAYKQPITAPEIMAIRGVQGAGVLNTLLDRKLVAAAGRKDVLGKPILYKTTREFLIQFGLNSLVELPTLKEFEELGRLALNENDDAPTPVAAPVAAPAERPAESQPSEETVPHA